MGSRLGRNQSVLGVDLEVLEAREVLRKRVVQPELAFLVKHQGGGRGDGFGHGVDAKKGILLHGELGFAVAQAIGFEMGDLSFAGNDHDPAGQALLLDEFFHLGVDFRQGLPGQADFGRVDRRQFGDRLSGGEKAGKERKEKAGCFVHGLIRELVGEGDAPWQGLLRSDGPNYSFLRIKARLRAMTA